MLGHQATMADLKVPTPDESLLAMACLVEAGFDVEAATQKYNLAVIQNGLATSTEQKHYSGMIHKNDMVSFAIECAQRQIACTTKFKVKQEPGAAAMAGGGAAAEVPPPAKKQKSHHKRSQLMYPLTKAMLQKTGHGKVRYEDLRRYKTEMCRCIDPSTGLKYKVPVSQAHQTAEDYRRALLAVFRTYRHN